MVADPLLFGGGRRGAVPREGNVPGLPISGAIAISVTILVSGVSRDVVFAATRAARLDRRTGASRVFPFVAPRMPASDLRAPQSSFVLVLRPCRAGARSRALPPPRLRRRGCTGAATPPMLLLSGARPGREGGRGDARDRARSRRAGTRSGKLEPRRLLAQHLEKQSSGTAARARLPRQGVLVSDRATTSSRSHAVPPRRLRHRPRIAHRPEQRQWGMRELPHEPARGLGGGCGGWVSGNLERRTDLGRRPRLFLGRKRLFSLARAVAPARGGRLVLRAPNSIGYPRSPYGRLVPCRSFASP